MDNNPDAFRRMQQQLEHLKRMVARYKQAEDWENFTFGDRVMIDNSDSVHDGAIGKFITHQWSSSGFVCLLVEFEDGSRHYYLPIHLVKHFDVEKMTAQDLEPLRSTPSPAPVVEPTPEKKGIDFSKIKIRTEEDLTADNLAFIDSKLAQVAKMPPSTRKKVLMGTMPPDLVDKAVKIGRERGILPA